MDRSVRHRGVTVYRHGARWRFTWRPENRWVSRDTLPEALAELDRLLDERERGRTSARIESLTVAELLDEWWARKQREIRESTQMRYESVLRLHVKPRIGHLPANTIRPLDIEDFYASVTHKTALVSRDCLRPAFRWGLANRLVLRTDAVSPVEVARLRRESCLDGDPEAAYRSSRVDERLIPPTEHIELLLDDAERRSDAKWWLYLRLAVSLGGRPGEICALRRRDFDERTCSVRVERAANKHTLRVSKLKTHASIRTLKAGVELFEDVMPLIAPLAPDAFLFPATGGRNRVHRIACWTANTVFQRLSAACERLGLPHYSPHALRHYCATHLLDGGWQPMQVARWLGHRNDTMVRMLYAAHIVEETQTQLGVAAGKLVRRRFGDPHAD